MKKKKIDVLETKLDRDYEKSLQKSMKFIEARDLMHKTNFLNHLTGLTFSYVWLLYLI